MTAIKQYIHALMYIMHMLWFSSNIKWAFIDLGKYNMYKNKWHRASIIFKLWLKNNTLLYVKVIERRISYCVIALYNIFMKVIVGNVFIKCFINQQPNTHIVESISGFVLWYLLASMITKVCISYYTNLRKLIDSI